MDKNNSNDFKIIPGVGKAMEKDFVRLGYKCVGDLKGENPEEMYERMCIMEGRRVDRCVLYVYRLSVYFAENDEHDSEKLKWWNWKD